MDAVLDLGAIPAKTTKKFHTIQCTNDQKWYEIRIARIEFWKKKIMYHVMLAWRASCRQSEQICMFWVFQMNARHGEHELRHDE
jgi:hypothetical protein